MDSSPGSKATFIQVDVSLLKNVDDVCRDIQKREDKINILFLTAGYMTLRGRNGMYSADCESAQLLTHGCPLLTRHVETTEGLDHKMAVNYYTRMRFILNLMPQLTAAGEANELSRAVSVLAAGSESDIRLDDLDLKKNFTLHACLAHCVMMTDFMIEELAERYRNTSFSHSYPGTVKTGIANQLTGPVRLAVKVLYAVMTPWILNVQESGRLRQEEGSTVHADKRAR